MTRFPQVPALHRCADRGGQRVYALCGDICFPDGDLVPRGMKIDGASRPWFLRKWLKRFGRGFAAFVRHARDYALRVIPRKEADVILYRLLIHLEVPKADRFGPKEARVIYGAVRMFGWISWRLNARRPLSYFFCTEDELIKPLVCYNLGD